MRIAHARSPRPHVAVVTNVMRDHLNAYDGMEDYAEAKAQIFRHQKAGEVLIVNAEDAHGRTWALEAPGTVKRFGTRKEVDARIAGGAISYGMTRVIRLGEMRLLGMHNAMNAGAALLAAITGGATITGVRKALRTFAPLPHRLETIPEPPGRSVCERYRRRRPMGRLPLYARSCP